MIDEAAFEAARQKIVGVDRQRYGIGTLAEKSVHAILKNYYEPDEDCQEIPVGQYVADICAKGRIIEIQTRQFYRLRGKLEAFLPLYPVTIVYPIPREKYLIWIDEESGELSKRRKSPRRGSAYTAFPELYRIKDFLRDPNLSLRFALLDMEEYRLLNGWSRDKKKGSTRFDRIPTGFVEEVIVDGPADYRQFLPSGLAERFTAKQFAAAAHITADLARSVLNILVYMETAKKVGKLGREYLYEAMRESGS